MGSRPRKILYVCEFSTGGSVESLHSLVTGLDRDHYDPTVLFYHEPAPDIRQRFEDEGAPVAVLFGDMTDDDSGGEVGGRNLQAKVRRVFGRHVEGIYASLKYIYSFLRYKSPVYRALRRYFAETTPDLVHFNNGLASDVPGILAAGRLGMPIVCHARANAVYTGVHTWASRYVPVFLCVSAYIRDRLLEAGVDPARTVVCHDSVNQQRFRKTDVDPLSLRREFGWDRQARVFAVIGRLDSWKGHETFIDAIDIVRRSDPSVVGLIVGDITASPTNRAYVDGLLQQVEARGLEDQVRFAGHRTNVPEIIQCLDGVVCSSSSPEPFGLMVVEAMAVETPVIATNAGGPAEMIEDGKSGLLVPPRDAAAMAEAMLRLTNDPALGDAFRSAGLETIAARFTVARHVARVCNAYDRVLAGSHGS